MRKCRKRKTTQKPAEDQNNKPNENNSEEPSQKAAGKGTRKKANVAKPEYFSEKRNLEDLWQQIFLVGTQWDWLDTVYQYKWIFSTLENAFEEGGELHDEKVYLFGSTEPQILRFQGQLKLILIPVVVAVVLPFPPSDRVVIRLFDSVTEEIVPMKQMKMDWVPYTPLKNRESQIERLKNSQIFILSCTQRRAGLRHLKPERVEKFEYCFPYFLNPLQEVELQVNTMVEIQYPKRMFRSHFDLEFDDIEDFVDHHIKRELLPADHKEPFKDYVNERVQEAKKTNREILKAFIKQQEEMNDEARAAFLDMRLYKFYPVPTEDTPDVSSMKAPCINKYYGDAHMVL